MEIIFPEFSTEKFLGELEGMGEAFLKEKEQHPELDDETIRRKIILMSFKSIATSEEESLQFDMGRATEIIEQFRELFSWHVFVEERGTEEAIKNATEEEIKSFFQRYTPPLKWDEMINEALLAILQDPAPTPITDNPTKEEIDAYSMEIMEKALFKNKAGIDAYINSNYYIAKKHLEDLPVKWQEGESFIINPHSKECGVLAFLYYNKKRADEPAAFTKKEISELTKTYKKIDAFFAKNWKSAQTEYGTGAQNFLLTTFIMNMPESVNGKSTNRQLMVQPQQCLITITSPNADLENAIRPQVDGYSAGFYFKNKETNEIENIDNDAGYGFLVGLFANVYTKGIYDQNNPFTPGNYAHRRFNPMTLCKQLGISEARSQNLTKKQYQEMLLNYIDNIFGVPTPKLRELLPIEEQNACGIRILAITKFYENGDIECITPYFDVLSQALIAEKEKTKREVVTATIHANAAKYTRISQDIAGILLKGIKRRGSFKFAGDRAGYYEYNISYRTLIERCPVLRDRLSAIREPKYKTRDLYRYVSRAVEILEKKSELPTEYKNFRTIIEKPKYETDIAPGVKPTAAPHCIYIRWDEQIKKKKLSQKTNAKNTSKQPQKET